jgi:hypothetical protein
MDIAVFAPLLSAVVGGAGLAAALASLEKFTESSRAKKAIEAAADALQHVSDDKAAREALRLAIKVASIQLAAVSLVRVPLRRLLMPFVKLLLISAVGILIITVLIGVLLRLFLNDAPILPAFTWSTWLTMAMGFFLAYRSALSERRDEFVSSVLAADGTDLQMVGEYSSSLKITYSRGQPVEEANAPAT